MPKFRRTSSTVVPPLAWRMTYVTYSSVKRDFFIAIISIIKEVKSNITLVLKHSTFLGGAHGL